MCSLLIALVACIALTVHGLLARSRYSLQRFACIAMIPKPLREGIGVSLLFFSLDENRAPTFTRNFLLARRRVSYPFTRHYGQFRRDWPAFPVRSVPFYEPVTLS